MHRQIPMMVGSGAGSYDQKLLLIVRKFVAETHRLSLTQHVMANLRGFCTDLGTESSEQIRGHKLTDVLPDWMQEQQLRSCEDDDMDVRPAAGLSSADDQEYLFPNALLSPGLLHTFDNMGKEIHH